MVCFNLILAAECLYSADDSVLLAQCMTKLAKPGLRIFVSMGRNRGGQGVGLSHESNSQDLQIVSVRSHNQLPAQTLILIMDILKDIISTKGTTLEIRENIQSGGEVSCQKAIESAEVFDIEGPLQQVQLLCLLLQRRLMWAPFTFDQAVVQSHQDLTIVVVLFDESDESVNVIKWAKNYQTKTLNEDTQLTNMLDSCLVFVAHNRLPCVSQMFECVGEDPCPLSGAHVLILQQVGATKR